MKRFFAALLFFAISTSAFAGGNIPARDCKFFNAVTAGSDRNSVTTFRALDLLRYHYASFHVVWASLTGSVDGVVKIQVSNDGTNWVDKSGATFTMSGANGSDLISLTSITEQFYKVVYTHNSISGGTLTGYCTAKEI